VTIVLLFDFSLSNFFVQKNNHCYNYSEYFYELKKNCSSNERFKKSFPTTKIFTDDKGLRVGKNNIKKDKNKKNILIFGDSFTFGVGLEYEETYAGIIKKKFKNYNVYNYGVGSYSPTVYLYRLKNVINENIRPDKVLIFLDLTDVIDEAGRWYFDEDKEKPKLRTNFIYKNSSKENKDFIKNNFKLSTNIISHLNYNLRNLRSYLKQLFFKKNKIKTSIQGSFTYLPKNQLDNRFWEKSFFDIGIKKIKDNFKEFENVAKKHDFDIYLVVYPWAETLEFGQDYFNWSEFAKQLCNYNNCHLIDAIPNFLEYKNKNSHWNSDLYFVNDEHFNAGGAKLLSTIVIEYIESEK